MAFPQDPSGPPFPGDAGNPSQRPAGNRPAHGARITGYGSPDDPTQASAGGSDNSWLFGSEGSEVQPQQPQPHPQPHPQSFEQPQPQPQQPQYHEQPQAPQPPAPQQPQFQQPRSQPHQPSAFPEPAPAPGEPAGPTYSNLPPLPEASEVRQQDGTWLMEHDGSLPPAHDVDASEEVPAGFPGSYAEPEDTTRQAARWAPRLMALVFLGALGAGGYRFYQRTAGLVGGGEPVESDESGLAPSRDLRQGVELVGSDRGNPASSPFRNDEPREIQSVRTRYDGATREPGELTVMSGSRERQPSASVDPSGSNERPGRAAQPGPEAPGSVNPDAQANPLARVTDTPSTVDGAAEDFVPAERRDEALATLDAFDALARGGDPVPSEQVPVRSLSPVLAGPAWLFVPEFGAPDVESDEPTVEAPSYLALGTDPLPVVILPTSPAPGQGMRPTVPAEEALRASIAFVGETPRVEVVPVDRDAAPEVEVVADAGSGSESEAEPVADADVRADAEPTAEPDSGTEAEALAEADPASEPLPAPVEVRLEVDSEARPEAPVTDRVALEVVPGPGPGPGPDFSLGESPDAWLERRSSESGPTPTPAQEGPEGPERPQGASPAVAALLESLESGSGEPVADGAGDTPVVDPVAGPEGLAQVEGPEGPGSEAVAGTEDESSVEPEGDVTVDDPAVAAVQDPEPEPETGPEAPVAVAQETPGPQDPADGSRPVDAPGTAVDAAPTAPVAVAVDEPRTPAAPVEPEESVERDALLGTYADWMVRQDVAPMAAPGGMTPFELARGHRPSVVTDDPEAVAASSQPDAPQTLGVLQRLSQEESWQGTEPPMQFLRSKQKVATPNVGAVRVMQKDGEMFEGRLLAIGQNKVWVDGKVGTMALMGERVRSVERLDPTQLDETGKVTSEPDYRALPHVRVRTAGGVFVGRQLDRDGDRITLMTDDGYKITLVSDDVQDADAASSPNLRRLDGKQ